MTIATQKLKELPDALKAAQQAEGAFSGIVDSLFQKFFLGASPQTPNFLL